MAVGEPDWNKTLERISPAQWEIYKVVDAIEGIGTRRLDRLFARLAAIVMASKGVDYPEDRFLFDVASQAKNLKKNPPVTNKPTKESTAHVIQALAGRRER